jgi:hypothetical protein
VRSIFCDLIRVLPEEVRYFRALLALLIFAISFDHVSSGPTI